ncbi:MAG: NAD(P)/FAD-dependent oxidoreductase [Eubacteriales bacterium]
MKNVVVIGGGPAGMMAAAMASENHHVTLFEKNEKLGKKLYITGKGRCNLTNACETESLFDHVVTNKNFLYSAFYIFSNERTISFLNELGLKTKVERGNRVFPQSDKSSDVIKILEKYLSQNHVEIRLNSPVKDIVIEQERVKGVLMDNDIIIDCNAVIIATGGLSYPQTGSTGDGYVWGKKAHHHIVPPKSALVPLTSNDDYVKELQGLSLRNVEATLYKRDIKIKSMMGEMLFTHFGISGPIILSLSSMMRDKDSYIIKINLKPALDMETLDHRIRRDFEKYTNKDLINALDDLLPKKLIPVIIKIAQLDQHKKVNQITKEERSQLVEAFQKLPIHIEGKRPLSEAIITSGGICVKEIDPATMASKKVKGLYFAGELIDVDALTGGFNMQIAFSTGYLAGFSC